MAMVPVYADPPSSGLHESDSTDFFEERIAPILVKRCLECHDSVTTSGDLDLSSSAGWQAGGETGKTVDPIDPADSLVLHRIKNAEMPPPLKGEAQPLPAKEAEDLLRWIQSGTFWPKGRTLDRFESTSELRAGRDWWSLQPLEPMPQRITDEIGRRRQAGEQVNPIDLFIQEKLKSNQLSSAPPANKRALIRRVHYTLIGLPPTQDEVSRFLNDTASDAWSRLVDDLLARPQYGERWARHWLDVVRYADTSGYERDQEKPNAWRYRDWVVDAFNEDLPYAQFIELQLAGDEKEEASESDLIATGFLRLGTWNDEPNDPQDYQYERLEDLVHTTSSAFLGMTVKCARCHSHKFDPIAQSDYYRMASVFWPGPIKPRQSKWLGGPSPEELGAPDVLGWTDITATPDALHILKNGDRHQPLEPVVPGALSFVPSLQVDFTTPQSGAPTTRRRTQLAEWLTEHQHPLTWRVMANRIWQHHFGQGLVRSPNNFGFLGAQPSHRELLDWLAAELIRSEGRIKELHRVILNSATWKQAVEHTEAATYQQRDASNQFLWHANRRRLDAEAIRDSLLAVSGELDLKMGGPSFHGEVSQQALAGLSKKSAAWKASSPAEQKRRSLYMHIKRGLMPPMMTAFDLCEATQTVGKRDVTTVPTQSLTLLNHPFVHQRSQHLAQTVVAQSPQRAQQISAIWMSVLNRQPTSQEFDWSQKHVVQQAQRFATIPPQQDFPLASDQSDPSKTLTPSPVVHFSANSVMLDPESGGVVGVADLATGSHQAFQTQTERQPILKKRAWNDQPVLWFDGVDDYLNVTGNLLTNDQCTIFCVVNDLSASGHREILSNWNSKNNVGSSFFFGLTSDNQVRITDAFSNAGQVTQREQPFLLTLVCSADEVTWFQSGRLRGRRSAGLPNRRFDTPWVIGQQGNIDGEYWKGGIAELILYSTALPPSRRNLIEDQLAKRFGLTLDRENDPATITTEAQALASLAIVLMNSNEFIYLD